MSIEEIRKVADVIVENKLLKSDNESLEELIGIGFEKIDILQRSLGDCKREAAALRSAIEKYEEIDRLREKQMYDHQKSCKKEKRRTFFVAGGGGMLIGILIALIAF
jgi:hypothetical protein